MDTIAPSCRAEWSAACSRRRWRSSLRQGAFVANVPVCVLVPPSLFSRGPQRNWSSQNPLRPLMKPALLPGQRENVRAPGDFRPCLGPAPSATNAGALSERVRGAHLAECRCWQCPGQRLAAVRRAEVGGANCGPSLTTAPRRPGADASTAQLQSPSTNDSSLTQSTI